MATIELTQSNFEDTIKNNDVIIIDFWAEWCGPCKSFAPTYEEVSNKYQDVVFAKVNTEQQQALAGHFQIRSIPTLMIFREQIIIFSQAGALSGADLEGVIEKAKGLDMNMVREELAKQETNPA
ncbi:thioredoxin [Candidatus Marithrix sp. Canyon 246]|uniref:thioredoxin n=1 Tax=Candidatus Marithrix sp. Canyon 246 TaxID=1827136 RepID=UPI00084A1C93|nr:thioredoxin [Candidatus Marithrix sp. Canyon 246]